MNQSYTAVVKQDGQWWIGWIEEVPGVNCQESTRDELLESLRITLSEALEMNRADAKKRRQGKASQSLRKNSRSLSIEYPSENQGRRNILTKWSHVRSQ